MPSVFTRVREHELPGDILYEDSDVFVILSIAPHSPGHLLVIPVEEHADIIQAPAALRARLFAIAHQCMSVTASLYDPPRVALISAGLEVDHAHLHVFSLFKNEALDHDAILPMSDTERTAEADRIRTYLQEHPIR